MSQDVEDMAVMYFKNLGFYDAYYQKVDENGMTMFQAATPELLINLLYNNQVVEVRESNGEIDVVSNIPYYRGNVDTHGLFVMEEMQEFLQMCHQATEDDTFFFCKHCGTRHRYSANPQYFQDHPLSAHMWKHQLGIEHLNCVP